MHVFPAVPVFKVLLQHGQMHSSLLLIKNIFTLLYFTSYFDIITMFLMMVSGHGSLQKISVLEPFPFSVLISLYRLILWQATRVIISQAKWGTTAMTKNCEAYSGTVSMDLRKWIAASSGLQSHSEVAAWFWGCNNFYGQHSILWRLVGGMAEYKAVFTG